ncbi:hypothetical protein WA158_003958 [Blastocystis sp. Blastoise]
MKFFFVIAVLALLTSAADIVCSQSELILTAGTAMPTVTCTGGDGGVLFAKPTLPEGLSIVNGVISGTPVKGQYPKEYLITSYIRFEGVTVKMSIAVSAKATYLSYGFKTAKAYSGLLMESYYPRSDSYFSLYSISPALPAGMSIDPATGVISGTPSAVKVATTYTVTAQNTLGSVSTTFSFEVVDQSTMTLGGLTGFYYTTMQMLSLRHTSIDFSDEWSSSTGGHVIPGLDDRFRDFWGAYYTGYIVIASTGEYTFKVESDDGASVYIDDFNTVAVQTRGCGGGTVENNIQLTAGKHLIFITYFDINLGAKLHVWFKSDALSISYQLLSESNTRIGGRAPTFLKYEPITGIAGNNIMVARPVFSSGLAQSFTVSPSLPVGLTIDEKGNISGATASPISGTYTVTMSGQMGSCEATITINIVSQPAAGLIASWYKIQDNGDLSSYKDFSDFITDLRVRRVEGNIYYPDTNGDGVLSTGLSSDMWQRVYATFEGYIYFDEIGVWEFAGQADDGFRLYFNDEAILEQWRIGGIEDVAIKQVAISKVGYYPVMVKYFEQAYGNGIIISWKRPNNNVYEVIPTTNWFHVPTTSLSYKNKKYIAFRGMPIISNTPVWLGATASGSYSLDPSSPALPAGLSLDASSGAILGTATADTAYKTYTIMNGSYKGSFELQVDYLEAPNGFTYKYNNADIPSVFEPTIGVYFEFRPYYNGRIDTWSCTPEPPRGIYIESYSGWFKGTPQEALNVATMFTLKACNQGGCATTTVTLKVNGCNNDRYWYTQILKGTGNIKIKEGATVGTSQSGSIGEYRHCFNPSATLTHIFECTSTEGCSYAFYRDDLTVVLTKTVAGGSTASPAVYENIFTTTFGMPTITGPTTTRTAYRLQDVDPIKFTITGGYKTATFSPALPSTAVFNVYKGQIDGYWPAYGTFNYQVTVTGPGGISSPASFSVNVISCGDSKTLIKIERVADIGNVQETFTITQNGETIFTGSTRNDKEKRFYAICLSYGNFELNLFDQYNDGWAPNSYVALYEENGNLLGKWTAPVVETSPYSVTINVESSIHKESTWKVSTAFINGWTSTDFNDGSWSTGKKGSYPNFVSNAIYLRQSFSIDDITKYPLIDISLYFVEGCIVYVNGQEIYRMNMASGDVNAGTLATAKYDAYIYRRTSAGSHQLKNGVNYICVEIHRKDVSTTSFDFDLYATLLQGTCINRINGYSLTNSGSYNMPFESVDYAFDDSTDTKWLEDGLPAYAQLEFNFDRRDFINKIQLYSGNDYSERDPRIFTLKGSNDKITWDTLLEVNQLSIWSERKQMREWWLTSSTKAYNTFKLEITATQGGASRTQLSEIKFFSCHITYCFPEGSFPTAQSGTTVTANCPSDYFGLQSRHCSDALITPSWNAVDMTNCKANSPPGGKAYIDTIIKINAVTLEGMNNGGDIVLKTVLSTLLGISSSNVETFLYTDASSGSVSAAQCYLRVTSDNGSADTTALSLNANALTIANNLKALNKNIFPDTTEVVLVQTPSVVKSTSLGAVVITVIVILAILAAFAVVFIVACIVFRTKKSSRKAGSNKLKEHSSIKKGSENNKKVRV